MQVPASDEQQSNPRKQLREMLGEPEPDRSYYAITLLGGGSDQFEWSIQSHFAGYTISRPRRELRAASLVDGPKLKALWEGIGQASLVVNTPVQLAIFVRLGGNALVEKAIAEDRLSRLIPRLLEPAEIGRDWLIGFVNMSQAAPQELRHAPTPAQRSRVMRRDGNRCRLCGRSSDESVHATLEVHHIARWGGGASGLTRDSNLITLCDTCHAGVTLEDSPELWIRASPTRPLIPEVKYQQRVKEYRDYFARQIEAARSTRPKRRNGKSNVPNQP